MNTLERMVWAVSDLFDRMDEGAVMLGTIFLGSVGFALSFYFFA